MPIGRAEAILGVLAFLLLLSLFLGRALVLIAGSDTVIVVSGGNNLSNFTLILGLVKQLAKLDHVVQSIEFLHVSYGTPSPCSMWGLPMKYREAWWEFESPIRGDLPRRPTQVIASQAWLDYSGMDLGDTLSLGRTILTVVGSVEAGGTIQVPDSDGNVSTMPEQLYFVPSQTIPKIVNDLSPQINGSFDFACHVRLKIYPSRFVDRVTRAVKQLWDGFDLIKMTQPAHAQIRRPAVSSIRILKVSAFVACLLGIVTVSKNRRILHASMSLWAACVLLICFLSFHVVLAPSNFVRFTARTDLAWLIALTVVMNLSLVLVSLARRERTGGVL